MSAAVVPWDCVVGPVVDMPGRWVCVPEGAEELTGYGADEDEATDAMIERHQSEPLH